MSVWRRNRDIKIMDTMISVMFTRRFLRQETFNETLNYPTLLAKALEAFMDRKYVHNLKSILTTRVKRITDNYVFYSFL